MKLRTKDLILDTPLIRRETYQTYLNKYFNLFMNAYEIKGLDYQQKDFMLRRFWGDGRIALFMLKGKDGRAITSIDHPKGVPVLTPYAPILFNIYDFPTQVNLINRRGVKFIPSTSQVVDKDVVIGYAQRNKKSVFTIVDYYVKKIVDVEMTIRTNLKSQKQKS